MLGGFCYLLYFCKKINDMEETKHIKISDYNYPLPDERIAKFPLPVRDQSKLCLLYTSPSPRDPKTSRMPSSA